MSPVAWFFTGLGVAVMLVAIFVVLLLAHISEMERKLRGTRESRTDKREMP